MKVVNCPQKFLQGKIEKNGKDNLRCQGHTELWTKTIEQGEKVVVEGEWRVFSDRAEQGLYSGLETRIL